MAIGERIRFIRNLRGMTQKYLGMAVGFDEKAADVRMAQYESGTRTPKAELTDALASALDVSPLALNVPDIESYYGLLHTLFAIEDLYGLQIGEIDGEVCLRLDKSRGMTFSNMLNMLLAWQQEAKRLKSGEITKEDYDHWRYTYPKMEAERTKAVLDAQRTESNKGKG